MMMSVGSLESSEDTLGYAGSSKVNGWDMLAGLANDENLDKKSRRRWPMVLELEQK